MTLDEARALDAADPLAGMRGRFALPDGLIYLDGNSLGPLPVGTAVRIAQTIQDEWGHDLIASWNKHGWIEQSARLAAMLAPIVGAAADELLVGDSTSINLAKLLGAALGARLGRRVILSQAGNFPTDLYIAAAVPGAELRTVAAGDIAAALTDEVAVLMLTQVDYRSAAVHDMAALSHAAHAAGALALWDLSHSAGGVRLDLSGSSADLAVGCGYKYLNGGPGAPAFLFVARALQEALANPLPGWFGHAEPFAFEPAYRPAPGIARFASGTPSIIAMAALEAGLAMFEGIDMAAIETKSRGLSELFRAEIAARCPELALASPADPARRGSHLVFACPHAYPLMQALIAHGVIGDYREPNLVRFGFAPLYNRFVEMVRAATIVAEVLATREWDQPHFHERRKVP
ncbi:MAG: kynureninase [Sphingomonas bacterium]|nr:kynureninase [Sphingomonas bacterium]